MHRPKLRKGVIQELLIVNQKMKLSNIFQYSNKSFKSLKVFLILLFLPLLAVPADSDNKIRWTENHRLTWDYFRGAIDPNRHPNTQAVAKVMIELNTTVRDFRVEFEATSYFVKDGSWTINTTSSHVLNHEQIHFDISEVFARKLRKRLSEIKGLTHRNIQERVNAVYQEVQRAHDDFQKRYDRETDHSNNHRMQEKWNKLVSDLLAQYSAYADTVVPATINQ